MQPVWSPLITTSRRLRDGSGFLGQTCGSSKSLARAGPRRESEEASSTVTGESRHAIALFASLYGCASVTERLDPEKVRDLMTAEIGNQRGLTKRTVDL
jgi:hypothetical protein